MCQQNVVSSGVQKIGFLRSITELRITNVIYTRALTFVYKEVIKSLSNYLMCNTLSEYKYIILVLSSNFSEISEKVRESTVIRDTFKSSVIYKICRPTYISRNHLSHFKLRKFVSHLITKQFPQLPRL